MHWMLPNFSSAGSGRLHTAMPRVFLHFRFAYPSEGVRRCKLTTRYCRRKTTIGPVVAMDTDNSVFLEAANQCQLARIDVNVVRSTGSTAPCTTQRALPFGSSNRCIGS